MLKKFGPGSDYSSEAIELDRKRSQIKHERQTIIDSSLVRLPKSLEKVDETLFMTSVEKAKLRNEALLKSIQKLNEEIETHLNTPDPKDFVICKDNYWEMVKRVLPAWEKELDEYRKRKRRENDSNTQDI